VIPLDNVQNVSPFLTKLVELKAC